MPVVLTDHTNRVWCMEQPDDNHLHAGFIGKGGPKIEDLLEFVESRDKQFKAFLDKKAKGITNGNTRNRNLLRSSKDRGPTSSRKEEASVSRKASSRGSSGNISSPGFKNTRHEKRRL